ncbi:MAG TPA: RNA 2',3'-cyclic phosphodiesterase [Rhizomicrobium sp.]|nr:RNA 2',3'-cyclic phosphodiesterase [Rhizomicrobium sp.]
MRLFVALEIPDTIAQSLAVLEAGVPGARWQSREQLHLTLRFIGEVDGRDASAIDDALSAIRAPKLTLALKGVGEFGGNKPHALWAGVAPNEALTHLQRKIETALQRIGLPPEQRKYTPHVTLARLSAVSRGRLMDFLVDHALYASGPFEADAFILYSSELTSDGSIYVPERHYALR